MKFNLSSLFLHESAPVEKEGIFYFTSISSNIKPSRDEKPTNKENWSYWRKSNFDFFQSELEKLPHDKILTDLGAGQSDFIELTSKFNLCAVDFYPYKGINVVCDFSKGLPFKNNTIDIIVMSNLLEHVAEPNLLLAECRRSLKPGGLILGTVPFMINIHQHPYDFYRYTDINLEYLLKKHSFQNISVKPVLATYIVLFEALTSFFVSAINKKRKMFLRALWWLVRFCFKFLNPVLRRYQPDVNTPLGYLFKAEKF